MSGGERTVDPVAQPDREVIVKRITDKCEQYWNESNVCEAEWHCALEFIHREARELAQHSLPRPGAQRRTILEEAARACEANYEGCDKANIACHRLDAEAIRALAQPEAASVSGAERQLRAALERSVLAIDDWLNIYASDHCDEQRVKEAYARVHERGTISYIADVQQQNRAALAVSSGKRVEGVSDQPGDAVVGGDHLKELVEAADAASTDLWWLVGGGDFAAGIKDGEYPMTRGAAKEYQEAKESGKRLKHALYNYQHPDALAKGVESGKLVAKDQQGEQ